MVELKNQRQQNIVADILLYPVRSSRFGVHANGYFPTGQFLIFSILVRFRAGSDFEDSQHESQSSAISTTQHISTVLDEESQA